MICASCCILCVSLVVPQKHSENHSQNRLYQVQKSANTICHSKHPFCKQDIIQPLFYVPKTTALIQLFISWVFQSLYFTAPIPFFYVTINLIFLITVLSNCVRPLPKNYQKTPYCLLNKKSKIHTRICRSTMTQPPNFMEILSLLFNLKTSESQLCAVNAERHQENAMISQFMMATNCFLTSPSTEGTHTPMSPLIYF